MCRASFLTCYRTPANPPAATRPTARSSASPRHAFTSVRIRCVCDFFLWPHKYTPQVSIILLNKALLCDPYQSAFPTFVTLCVCVCGRACLCVCTRMRFQGKQTHPSTFQLAFHRLTEVALYTARHRRVQCVSRRVRGQPGYCDRSLQPEINH